MDQERKAGRASAPQAAATTTGQLAQPAPLQLYFPPSVISPMPQALVGWVWCR